MAWEVRLELKLVLRGSLSAKPGGEMAWEVRLELKLCECTPVKPNCKGEMAWEVRLELKRLIVPLLSQARSKVKWLGKSAWN